MRYSGVSCRRLFEDDVAPTSLHHRPHWTSYQAGTYRSITDRERTHVGFGLARRKAQALLVLADPVPNAHRKQIIALVPEFDFRPYTR
jgi:hypothetical protein